MNFFLYLCGSLGVLCLGEMLEWLKRHAWKACKLQKGFGGSNPPLSAKIFKTTCLSSLKHGGRKIFAQDARGRLWGLRRNPPPRKTVADCGYSRWASVARSVSSNPHVT